MRFPRSLRGDGAPRFARPASRRRRRPADLGWREMMLDAMYLALGFGFLIVAVLYVMACDRL
jgi:hypothetical protein